MSRVVAVFVVVALSLAVPAVPAIDASPPPAVLLAAILALGALVLAVAAMKEKLAVRANARLAAVLNYVTDAILFVNREGHIEEANRAAEQLYGRSRKELCTMELSDLRADLEGEPAIEELAAIESSGRRSFRTHHRNANGTISPVEISSRFVNVKGLEGFVVIVRDVSQTVAAEREVRRLQDDLERRVLERTAQLAEANRELEAFSYSVSHDLRAPLRAMDGFSRILAQEYGESLDDEGRRLLGIVRASAQRMGRLIDDLLEFSRAGRRDIQKSLSDMNAIVRSLVAELQSASTAAPAKFELSELPPASCDAPLMRQVWENLLTNAMKFSSSNPGAAIEVGSRRENGHTTYYVRDHGVGFDMQYAGKLFGVFQRLHSQREFEGTGVGLALVQRIVRRHGGEVWAEGEVGRGATFYFSLPDDADGTAQR